MSECKFKVERTALIDADFIAYQLAAWAHGNQATTEEMTQRIEDQFDEWMSNACCTYAFVCFSCDREDGFRKDHYPLYKSNRTSTPPALLPKAQRAVARAGDKVIRIPRLEADDIMGILATNGKVENPVIITQDKDLRQIPGWHFNPAKEDFPVQVTEVQGDYTFYTQWLAGDSTDGFGGIKGCGPAKAAKILNGGLWQEQVMRAYATAGYTAEDAINQARCAKILRAEDYNSNDHAVIPWSPSDEAIASAFEPES